MPTTTIGQHPCPECGSLQAVKNDGRKYFIHCTDCKTFVHYQTKAAKQRIAEKLKSKEKKEQEQSKSAIPETLPVKTFDTTPKEKNLLEPVEKPEKKTEKSKSFLERLNDSLL